MTSLATTARARPLTVVAMARAALANPAACAGAAIADAMFRSHCTQTMPRIPGCDTRLRLAIRIDRGLDPTHAAAHEYCYRWQLFLGAWINHTESRSTSRFIQRAMCYPAPRLLGQ